MATTRRVGFDSHADRALYAVVAPTRTRPYLVAAGALEGGQKAPRVASGLPAHISLRAGDALVSALPGVAVEEAEEAFRWEVAKSGVVSPDSTRRVLRRGAGADGAPPFLGLAADPDACEMRIREARAAGLAPSVVTIDALAYERLLLAAGKLPAKGAVLHVDVREGTSVVSAFGAGGLAFRRTIRTAPVTPEGLAIDLQRSASYVERKLMLPAAEAVYLTGLGVDPAIVEGVAAGLPGIKVEALDPLGFCDHDPSLDMTAVGALAFALALPIGLALVGDDSPADFLTPAEQMARRLRAVNGRLRVAAAVLIPAVLGVGLYVQREGPRAARALAEAEAKLARQKLIEAKVAEVAKAGARAKGWVDGLRALGERDARVVEVVLALAASLPAEAFLTELDVKARGDDLDVRLRGELVAADESATLTAREPLRRATQAIAPNAQVVFDVARRVASGVRIGFSIDGVAARARPAEAPAATGDTPGRRT